MDNQNIIFIFALAIGLIASALTYVSLPLVNKVASGLNLYDQPNARKIHTIPLVRLGGISIFLGSTIALVIALLICNYYSISLNNNELILIIFLSSLVNYLVGLADDLLILSPFPRLICQVLISIFCWNFGIRIEVLDVSFLSQANSVLILPQTLSILITILWIAGVTNAMNWLDGIDCLASTVAFICFGYLAIVSLSLDQKEYFILATTLAGSCIAFIPRNLQHPKILMGDGGSYLLGSNLAIISILGCSKLSAIGNIESIIWQIPLLILAIPIIDMTIVIFGRLKNGRSPFFPDKTHLHHKLLKSNLSSNQVVIFLGSACMLTGSISLMSTNIENIYLLIILNLVILYGFIKLYFFDQKFK